MGHAVRPVYRALSKPLTVLGVERRLFFAVLMLAVLMFNLFGEVLPALVVFAVLWLAARSATRTDPQILRIIINSNRFAARYDPAKWSND